MGYLERYSSAAYPGPGWPQLPLRMSRAVLDSLSARPFKAKGTKELLRAWILFNSFTIKPLVTSGKEVAN